MACYTVHAKSRIADPDVAREKAIFVRDGWTFAAFAFGPFWLLAKGHFVVGFAALVLEIGVFGLLAGLGLPPGSLLAVAFLLGLLWGFEGASLRRLALRLSRHDEVGLVVATAEDEAERRFFADDVKAETLPARATPAGFVPHGTDNPVMGLFPQARGSA
jgi:hypothetical protein